MRSGPINANTLPEYYQKLCSLQMYGYDDREGHGEDYILVHNELTKLIKGCDSYTEFGINQGATLAAVILENPEVVRAYDIKLNRYNKAKDMFENYTVDNNIDYKIFQDNTLKCNINTTDLLYIDTVHIYSHLVQELKRHGHMVRKYIVFHDTAAQEELKKAVEEYIERNSEWSIIIDCKINVGFMTIKRNII